MTVPARARAVRLAGCEEPSPCRAVLFLRFSKEVLVDDESSSQTEPGGGALSSHPQGLRSGTRGDRVPQMEDAVNRPGRGQPYVITEGPLAT